MTEFTAGRESYFGLSKSSATVPDVELAWDFATGRSLPATLRANADSQLKDNLFVEWSNRTYTYGAFADAVDNVAAMLRHRGVARGDRVLINLPSTDKYLIAAYAILRVGAVYVTSGWDYTSREVEYQLRHSGATAIITDIGKVAEYGLRDILANTESALRVVITACAQDDGVIGDLERALCEPVEEIDIPWPTSSDLAMIMYTSGTTSQPKGVVYSHGNLYVAAVEQGLGCGLRPEDRLLNIFPLHHANGFVCLQAPMLLVGGTVILERFSASRFGEQLHRHRATVTALNASHVKMIVRSPESEFDGRNSVRSCFFGLPIGSDDVAEFDRRFGIPLIGRYGSTESLGPVTFVPQNGLWAPPNSSGLPFPGVEIRLVDEAGHDVPSGGTGEVLIRRHGRHGTFLGYYRDPDATALKLADGWLHSGDLGIIGPNGHLQVVGRKDFQIKRSGYNVSPSEVESVVNGLPGVSESCLVAIPDPVREMALVLYYECEHDAEISVEEIASACAAQLASYKVPQFIARVSSMPMDGLGKISVKKLRAQAARDFSNAVSQ